MAIWQSLLALPLILALHVAGAATVGPPAREAFHAYMHEHGRGYAHGSEEYHTRLALFAQRVAEVEAHNAKPNRLWTAGVNGLSDRTEEELAGLRGWRGAAAGGSASPQRSGSTFLSQRGRGRSLPQEVMNWTSLRSAKHILDQGGCGSCWAVSTVSVLQQHLEIYNPSSTKTFSAQELVSCVPNPHKCGGTGGCQGATIELALDWTLNRGLAEESETPYRGSDTSCKKSLVDGGLVQMVKGGHSGLSLEELTKPGVHLAQTGAQGLAFGMKGWERLPENGYEPLLRAVYERGPVGVSVAARAWSIYYSGVFDGCAKDAVIDHAVVLVAYGKDKKLGKLFYLIQNSWGPSWGENGHIRLLRRENDAEQCGTDRQPEVGTGCTGGPKQVKVCGMCGVLYDSSLPHFASLSR